MANASRKIEANVAGTAGCGVRIRFPVVDLIPQAQGPTAGGMAGHAVPDILGIGDGSISFATDPARPFSHRDGRVDLVVEFGGERFGLLHEIPFVMPDRGVADAADINVGVVAVAMSRPGHQRTVTFPARIGGDDLARVVAKAGRRYSGGRY